MYIGVLYRPGAMVWCTRIIAFVVAFLILVRSAIVSSDRCSFEFSFSLPSSLPLTLTLAWLQNSNTYRPRSLHFTSVIVYPLSLHSVRPTSAYLVQVQVGQSALSVLMGCGGKRHDSVLSKATKSSGPTCFSTNFPRRSASRTASICLHYDTGPIVSKAYTNE